MAKKRRLIPRNLIRGFGKLARVLFRSQLLTLFFVLCVTGIVVGLRTRPDPTVVPYADLFREMRVVSYRESPSDTAARFVVDLCAGGQVFRRYDVDAGVFVPAPRDRDYNRAITGTVYPPLEVRGHVAQGLWLDVPRAAGPSLLPEQFDELYRATLDFVKPVSMVAGALGTLSGYSVGYRLGAWNSSLRSRAVQERVLATPNLGPVLAREAWRRVLLEPVVSAADEDVKRLAATSATQRIYTNFFRIALNDSDGFIPREASRLQALGRTGESRAMLAFAEAIRRAKLELPVTSADFDAIERWASLLVRRGHWAAGAIPPAGEARASYLGTLAWFGVAPPAPETNRIWVGPRLLVREGETEGFVADDIPATGLGCPIGWRAELQSSGATTWASLWFADHPEFRALETLAHRAATDLAERAKKMAVREAAPSGPVLHPVARPAAVTASATRFVEVLPRPDSASHDTARAAAESTRVDSLVP